MIVVPLTAEHVLAYYGEPAGVRMWGYAGILDGQVIAIGGAAFWPNRAVSGFLDCKPEARRYRFALHRAGLRGLARWRQLGGQTLRIFVDPDVPRACEWARRLGFVQLEDNGSWIWRGT